MMDVAKPRASTAVSVLLMLCSLFACSCTPGSSIETIDNVDFTSRALALTCTARVRNAPFVSDQTEKCLYLVPFAGHGRTVTVPDVQEVSATTANDRVAVSFLEEDKSGRPCSYIIIGPPFDQRGAAPSAGRFRGSSPLFVPGSSLLSYLDSGHVLLRNAENAVDLWRFTCPESMVITGRLLSPGGQRMYLLLRESSPGDNDRHMTVVVDLTDLVTGKADITDPANQVEPRVTVDPESRVLAIDSVAPDGNAAVARFDLHSAQQSSDIIAAGTSAENSATAAGPSWWITDGLLERKRELKGYLGGSAVWLNGNQLLYMRPGLEMVVTDVGTGTERTIKTYPGHDFSFTLHDQAGKAVLAGTRSDTGQSITEIISLSTFLAIGVIRDVKPIYFKGSLLILNTGHSLTTFDYTTGKGRRIMDL